ncbi:MAG: hypothetical protein KC609_12090 [Myxococcales bacterium]|nr:hypothetical protein [Myxococcales bacterium]
MEHSDLRAWLRETRSLTALHAAIGRKSVDGSYLHEVLGVPHHLQFVVARLAAERAGVLDEGALDSIPFYSLCRGLFLPLSGLTAERAAHHFGVVSDPPLDTAAKDALLQRFLAKEIGLGPLQKVACVLGDPFFGKPSTMRRDSLVRLLMSVTLRGRREFLDRLAVVGDVAVLFAEARPSLRIDPPLTAAEVLETLRLVTAERRAEQYDILRSLVLRCGKLEAYFLAKLLLRKGGFGFEYQGPYLARMLAEHFGVDADVVTQAMALTDVFEVTKRLSEQGEEGLRSIRLQPLVPVRPALAGGTVDELKRFPVWVERKYDGVRLMLHKSSDARGAILCGAYTRNRGDWLELVAGLSQSVQSLPCRSAIIDGELHGFVPTPRGARPATVYDVHQFVQGDRSRPLQLRYAAFDLLFVDGQDWTGQPLSRRRERLQALFANVAGSFLPVPCALAEGQLASNAEDLNRLYQHFRAQGYEGVIAKDLGGRYRLASRDATWLKRKPAMTLDLALIGAVFAVTEKERHGMFGSYVIAARNEQGAFEDIGDVAGVDRQRDLEIQGEIMREGLITGRRIERASASGARSGLELRPHIVATLRFEGVVKDNITGRLSLRSPALVYLRSDKPVAEVDSTRTLEELYLRQRVG